MSFSQHPRAYGSVALAAAFVAGILITLGFKDIYPDLESTFQQHWKRAAKSSSATSRKPTRRRSFFAFGSEPVKLEDNDQTPHPPAEGPSPPLALTRPLPSSLPPIAHGIESTIGHTPLILIPSLSKATGRTILAKAEYLNGAGGSPKDRVALSLILAAEASGHLVPGRGDTIYEGTSGSTGISLATLARARGYRAHIIMPDDVGHEKSDLLRVLGATVERVAVAPITAPGHFVNLARSRAREHTADAGTESRGFFADQFENVANHTAHFEGTGPEIFEQTGGKLDAFVAGSGTGGTISGVARYLKDEARGLPDVKVVLADPEGSGLYNKVKYGVMYSPTEREGTRRRQQVDSIVEGIGLTRLTSNFEAGRVLIDDAVKVNDEQACRMAQWLVEYDGIFAGSSSAVNCVAAVVTAMSLPPGSQVVTILCDSGQRHLSKMYKMISEMDVADMAAGTKPADLFASIGIKCPDQPGD